jgi:hypothetical protein
MEDPWDSLAPLQMSKDSHWGLRSRGTLWVPNPGASNRKSWLASSLQCIRGGSPLGLHAQVDQARPPRRAFFADGAGRQLAGRAQRGCQSRDPPAHASTWTPSTRRWNSVTSPRDAASPWWYAPSPASAEWSPPAPARPAASGCARRCRWPRRCAVCRPRRSTCVPAWGLCRGLPAGHGGPGGHLADDRAGLHRRGLHRFETHTHSRTLPVPTAGDQEIFRGAWALFESKAWADRPVRLIGVGLSGFEEAAGLQPDLFAAAPAEPARA